MRRRPSAALVLSSVALFVALGGRPPPRRRSPASRLAGNSVTGAKIRDGSLAAKDLSSRARRTLKTPANRSVSAAKLRPNAVRAAAIARGAVRSAELAAGARARALPPIGASKLGAGQSARPRWPTARCGHATSAATRVTCSWTSGRSGRARARRCRVGLSQAAEDAVALVTPPANWPAPIQVTAVLGPGDRSISVLACNFTGAAADPGPVSFRYLLIEFS